MNTVTPTQPVYAPLISATARRRILSNSIAVLIVALAAASGPVQAATVVTEAGVTVTFDTAPAATEWSTSSIAGGAGDVTDPGQMDGRVGTLSAAAISTPLLVNANATIAAVGTAQYSSVSQNIQTRPTAVAFTPVMATLQNGAGGNVSSLLIEYDFGATASLAESPGLDGHRVYFSLDGTSWTNVSALSGSGAATRRSASVELGSWASGASLFLLWADDNGPSSPDTAFSLDNVHFVPTLEIVPGRNLVYNRNHTAGGAPNGSLDLSGSNYFLEGATSTSFAANDVVNFSQDGSATINVPADVTTGGVALSHSTGTYTIGGPGKIRGPLTKSNAGTVVFTSANAFSRSNISGGTVETQAGALGSGTVTMSNGALWKVTTTPQVHTGVVALDTGGGTIQTDVDLSASGIGGTGALKKTGPGTLMLVGSGDGSGGIDIQAGKVSVTSDSALGGNTQSIKLNATTLEFANGSDVTFSDAIKTRLIDVGTAGGTISVTAPGAANPGTVGVIISQFDTFTGSGTITKTGDGALRMRADHFGLTSDWIVAGGTLESGQSSSPLGNGKVTVNAGGRLAGQNFAVPSNITLAGGDLGTRSGDNTDFTGAVVVTANSTVTMRSYTTPANAQNITISGVLSGTGELTLNGVAATNPNGPKALILTNDANTFAGTFHVAPEQTLTSQAVTGAGSTLNGRPIILSNGTLRIRDDGTGNDGTLAYGNDITVDTGNSTLDLDRSLFGINTGNTVQFGSLTIGNQTLAVTAAVNNYKARFTGPTTLTGNATFTPDSELILAGAISGNFGITQAGSGKLILNGTNSYTGPTSVTSGTLLVNGSLNPASNLTVNGTLGGHGTIGGPTFLNAGATLAPGDNVGVLSFIGDLFMTSTSVLSLELAHGSSPSPIPGTDYDQVSIGVGTGGVSTGSVNVEGVDLALTLGTGIRTNDLFFVLINDGNDPLTGRFTNLPDGTLFTRAGQDFRISYQANSAAGTLDGGNDIALLAIPEPGSAALLASGSALLLRRRKR